MEEEVYEDWIFWRAFNKLKFSFRPSKKNWKVRWKFKHDLFSHPCITSAQNKKNFIKVSNNSEELQIIQVHSTTCACCLTFSHHATPSNSQKHFIFRKIIILNFLPDRINFLNKFKQVYNPRTFFLEQLNLVCKVTILS